MAPAELAHVHYTAPAQGHGPHAFITPPDAWIYRSQLEQPNSLGFLVVALYYYYNFIMYKFYLPDKNFFFNNFKIHELKMHIYRVYTKECCEKLVVTPTEHQLWRLHSTTGRCSPPIFTGMYECFSIVFFNSAGSDVLQKETTTFSFGHPVRRI